MHKIIFCIFFVLISMPVHAQWYLGAEAQYNNFKLDQNLEVITNNGNSRFFKEEPAGINLNIGYIWPTHVGLEFGYSAMERDKYSGTFVNGLTTVVQAELIERNTNVYLDLAYFFAAFPDADIKISAGIGRLVTSFDGVNITVNQDGSLGGSSGNTKSKDFTPRAGIGLVKHFCGDWQGTVMLRHQRGNKFIKYFNTVGIGISYKI